MTIKEIQEECRKRYPVGTIYICPLNNHQFKVEENHTNTYDIYDDNSIDAGYEKGYFYYKGKFAEIVSVPETIVEHKIDLIL